MLGSYQAGYSCPVSHSAYLATQRLMTVLYCISYLKKEALNNLNKIEGKSKYKQNRPTNIFVCESGF